MTGGLNRLERPEKQMARKGAREIKVTRRAPGAVLQQTGSAVASFEEGSSHSRGPVDTNLQTGEEKPAKRNG